MANETFEDHPTDPNKVILRKKPYLDKGSDYEHGFIDGMQYQMQSSVDRAVNGMSRTPLTDEEINDEMDRLLLSPVEQEAFGSGVRYAERKHGIGEEK